MGRFIYCQVNSVYIVHSPVPRGSTYWPSAQHRVDLNQKCSHVELPVEVRRFRGRLVVVLARVREAVVSLVDRERPIRDWLLFQ